MNKLKLLFISILTPLLCLGVSFCASPVPGYLVSSYSLGRNDCNSLGGRPTLSNFYNPNDLNNISFGCIYVYGPSGSIRGLQGGLNDPNYLINGNIQLNFGGPDIPLFLCGNSNYLVSYMSTQIELECNSLGSNFYIGFDLYDIPNGGGSDCSEVESELSSCEETNNFLYSELSILSGNYATCQSSLASCQNNGSNCDTLYGVCVENLSGCNADKVSLQNYNDSLSTQLNECLSQNESCSGSGENGSGLMLVNNSLFWYYDDSLLSLPITNNLFLPIGYKGILDSGNVLSITSINNDPVVYEFTDDDKNTTVNSLGLVMLFLIFIGCVFAIFKFFKKILHI